MAEASVAKGGWAFWVPSHNNHPLVIRPKEETRRCEHRASGVFFRCARQDTWGGGLCRASAQPTTALPGSAPFFIALPRSVRRLLPLRGRLIGRGVGLRRSFAAGSGTLFGIWPRPAVCRRDGLLGGL